jgi:hypothetical protein
MATLSTDRPITPLSQRILEDMAVRGLREHTRCSISSMSDVSPISWGDQPLLPGIGDLCRLAKDLRPVRAVSKFNQEQRHVAERD